MVFPVIQNLKNSFIQNRGYTLGQRLGVVLCYISVLWAFQSLELQSMAVVSTSSLFTYTMKRLLEKVFGLFKGNISEEMPHNLKPQLTKGRMNDLAHTIYALSMHRGKEAKKDYDSGKIGKVELARFIVFSELPLSEDDKQKIQNHDYKPFALRLYKLNKNKFYDESMLLSIAFLMNSKNTKTFYESDLDDKQASFKDILYMLCHALIECGEKDLFDGYHSKLTALLIMYPSKESPTMEQVEKLAIMASIRL